jgi:hypothetical protein
MFGMGQLEEPFSAVLETTSAAFEAKELCCTACDSLGTVWVSADGGLNSAILPHVEETPKLAVVLRTELEDPAGGDFSLQTGGESCTFIIRFSFSIPYKIEFTSFFVRQPTA